MFRRCLFSLFHISRLGTVNRGDSSFIFSKTHVVGVSKSWLRKDTFTNVRLDNNP